MEKKTLKITTRTTTEEGLKYVAFTMLEKDCIDTFYKMSSTYYSNENIIDSIIEVVINKALNRNIEILVESTDEHIRPFWSAVYVNHYFAKDDYTLKCVGEMIFETLSFHGYCNNCD